MTLQPLKSEVDSIASLLSAGAESPEAMAKDIIRAIYNELLPQRTVYVTAFDLGNSVWVASGLYPTRQAAFKDAHKQPVAQISSRALIAALAGSQAPSEAHREPTGDWKWIKADIQAWKEGKKHG